ncbi:MAG TPA: pentapeptide repeat-containing protein [Pyrinomonadaceae bacterium]|nr:pentapeptide repeat-containing protein [Pyrinomonadaceae bacterium]
MTTSPAAKDSEFTCECKDWIRSSCIGEPFFLKHEGERYCVFHLPGEGKSAAFYEALQKKLDRQDYNFRGFWFPALSNFSGFKFNRPVDFTDATFNADTRFIFVVFYETVSFEGATFNANADFSEATFERNTNFQSARFRATVDFRETSFKNWADFNGAVFEDHVVFSSKREQLIPNQNLSLDLQFARVEKPDHFSFHTLTLHPHSFVNVDARKFEFTNVEWDWRGINEEIESLVRMNVPAPHRMLAIACRHLAVNAEENHRYEEASRFRYMAMDARRLEHWWGMDFRRLSWWYWLASGYGERIVRAAVVLLGIFLLSAALYTQVGFARWEPRMASESDAAVGKRDEVGAPLKLSRALTYSAAVMTFQRPEPRPATTAAQTIVLLETVLGPVQAALLALAIRRKFMR